MKKLLFSFVMLIAAVVAWAQHVEQDGLRFYLYDSTPKYAEVEAPASGTYSGVINIPSSVSYGGEDYTVKYIGGNAFKESAVTKVTIPSSVTDILNSAFEGCASLTEVNLSEGLEQIGAYAFEHSAVTSLTIPGTVTTIGVYAMEGMASLTKLTFAYGTEELALDGNVFNGTNNVTELVIDRYYTFGNGNGISYNTVKKVTFGEHLTTIPKSVCQGMSLNELNVGANVNAVDSYAFFQCTLPEGYNFPFAQIKEIKDGAFYLTKNLPANLDLSGVETIESMAFANCEMKTVKLGSSLTTLGEGAFNYCDQLTSVNIPGGINSFTSNTFYGCNKLTNVTFDYSSTALTLEDGTFSYATNLTIDRTISGTTPFSTSAVKKVALGSHMATSAALTALNLSQYTALTEIELLDGWTEVPSNAFKDLATVTTLTLPNGLKTIGYQAFSGCTGLTSVNLPDGLETIGDGAFRNCTATFNGVPSTVTSIGQSAFSGCTGLTGALVVPAGVTQLGGTTFSGTGITSVTIPGTVTLIGQYDFADCANLKTVTLLSGENKLTIGKRCFYNSNNITDVTIDRDFSYYNDLEKNRSPFNTAIERVTFGSNVTRVGDRALASCQNLTDVVLPDNITTVGVEAFKWSKPQTLTLSKNLTTVEDYGFYGMIGSALPTLTLPMNMSAVGKQAYYDIPNLTGVYVPWIDPLFALANDTESEKTFSYATNQTLWIPGGTLASYQAADGWKRFQNFDYWSFVVNATVAGKGQLDVANGEAVHANGTNTAKSVTGTQLVGAGAGTPVSGLFVREKDVTFTATPARGYELSTLTANGTDVKAASKVANLLADQNIAAEFTPIVYNITYNNLLNGVVDPANPATYTVEDNAITLVNSTRTAYNFKGWTGTDLTEPTMNVTIPASSIGDREFTATWEPIVYDITYDLAGGAVDPANLEKYTIETADFTLTNPTKLGYTFTGWEGTDLTEKTMAVTVTTGHWGDRAYTATWEPNPYKVRFDINGGDGTETMADQDHVYDAPLNLTQNAFTRTGYTFKEWNSKADGTGTVYADKAEVVNLTAVRDEVVTLYAQWTPNPYQVRFNANNGTGTMANQDFVYDTQKALTENAFSRTGYTFKQWTANADGTGATYADKASVKNLTAELNGIVDLYAQWQVIPYTVTYDLAGGSVATANPTEYNVETATFTLTNPTREGYNFAGWTGTDLGAATQTVTIPTGSYGNRSYTATWTPIVYDITYDLAGGSVATANPTSYTIETATFTLTNPTKAHWIFKGWTGTGLSAAAQTVTIAKGSIGTRAYTATWEREVYTVSITSNLANAVTASTTSPQYEDDVVLTIADDEDYDLVSLTVDGIDVTSQISGGQYTISSVSANVAVVATYNANKAFITMAHAQQTFSCTQPLDFTGVTGLKAYIASGYIDGTVVLTRVDKVPASTGLFLVGTEGAEYKVPFAASSAFYSNLLKPVLTAQTVPSEADGCTNFLYSEVNGVKGFYKSSGSGTVAAGKAYLQLPTSALSNGVKAVGFIFEGDETGIDATEFSGRQLPTAVYDMAGRKVADTFDAKKLPQGVYIVNGKKIAIK